MIGCHCTFSRARLSEGVTSWADDAPVTLWWRLTLTQRWRHQWLHFPTTLPLRRAGASVQQLLQVALPFQLETWKGQIPEMNHSLTLTYPKKSMMIKLTYHTSESSLWLISLESPHFDPLLNCGADRPPWPQDDFPRVVISQQRQNILDVPPLCLYKRLDLYVIKLQPVP